MEWTLKWIPLFPGSRGFYATGEAPSEEPTLPLEGLIRTIYDFRPYPESEPSLWLWWGMILPGVIVAWLLWRIWKKKKGALSEKTHTPYQIARARLLETYATVNDLAPKTLAEHLSHAVRDFLEEAFALPAPERTTEEILPELARHPVFSGELSQLISDFLKGCDLAKFGRHQFSETDRERLYQVASEIVDQAHLRQTTQQAGVDESAARKVEAEVIP